MKPGFVRIIAGEWRGRKLKIPNVTDLRPTPDRVRETLFNWLAPHIPGAHCLDLFAGSGVLGFEALSRGAASVTMVDQSPEVVQLLESQLHAFGAKKGSAYLAKLPQQLRHTTQPFDIVFIDPPYQADLLLPTCHHLEDHDFLASSAYLYLEARQIIKDNELPKNWRLIKNKQAGQVAYHLVLRECHQHESFYNT